MRYKWRISDLYDIVETVLKTTAKNTTRFREEPVGSNRGLFEQRLLNRLIKETWLRFYAF